MRAKRKPPKRKPAKKPSRRRARPITAPELVFPPGSFPPPAKASAHVDERFDFLRYRPRDTRTFMQRVRDLFRGKP